MVGIDLEKGKQIPMPAQKSLLRSFVKLAIEKQLPLQIHSRFDDGKYLVFNCSDVLCVIFSTGLSPSGNPCYPQRTDEEGNVEEGRVLREKGQDSS